MADFATVDDLAAIGVPVADQVDRVQELLRYASAIIRGAFPDIDDRIDSEAVGFFDLVQFVTVSMVKRALASSDDEATSLTDVAGQFQRVRSFSNGTGLYLSAREQKMLRRGGSGSKAFTVNPIDVADGSGVQSLPYWGSERA
jgi:hypothetical protein